MARKDEKKAIAEAIDEEIDIISELARAAAGYPLPKRDWDGNIVKYSETTNQEQLVALAKLADKRLPNLKAVDGDAPSNDRVEIVIHSSVPLPGSRIQRDDRSLAAPDAVIDAVPN